MPNWDVCAYCGQEMVRQDIPSLYCSICKGLNETRGVLEDAKVRVAHEYLGLEAHLSGSMCVAWMYSGDIVCDALFFARSMTDNQLVEYTEALENDLKGKDRKSGITDR